MFHILTLFRNEIQCRFACNSPDIVSVCINTTGFTQDKRRKIFLLDKQKATSKQIHLVKRISLQIEQKANMTNLRLKFAIFSESKLNCFYHFFTATDIAGVGEKNIYITTRGSTYKQRWTLIQTGIDMIPSKQT